MLGIAVLGIAVLGVGVGAPQVFYRDLGAPGLAGENSGAPTGRDITAQGSALGQESPPTPSPCRGEIMVYPAPTGRINSGNFHPGRCPGLQYPALSGLGAGRGHKTQGAALGYNIPPFQGLTTGRLQPRRLG